MRSSIRLTPRDVKENFPKFFGRRVGRLSRGAQIYPPHRHGSAPRQCPWLSHLAPVRSPVRLARWILPSHPAALRMAASRCLALTGSGILILESEASKAPSDFPWRENGKTVIRSREELHMTHLAQPFSRRKSPRRPWEGCRMRLCGAFNARYPVFPAIQTALCPLGPGCRACRKPGRHVRPILALAEPR